MSKKTLLDIVQEILSDMNSDEVNSIADTVESLQVAKIVKSTYEEIIGNRLWPHLRGLTQLEASTDTDRPTHMKLPENVRKIEWLKYNKETSTDTYEKYGKVDYLQPFEFINKIVGRDSSKSNIDTVIDTTGVELFILNDTAPTHYTSFDEEYIIFNNYDIAVESTLQKSKTICYAYLEPIWRETNEFIPNLPSQFFPYLIAEAKSASFNAVKQDPNAKEEQKSRRQRTWTARENFRVDGGIKFPNYGRKQP